MRFAMAQPCLGSSETVLRIKRSSVPWTRSVGFAILWLSTIGLVDCQGMAAENSTSDKSANRTSCFDRFQVSDNRVNRPLDEPWAQPKEKCAPDSLAEYIVWVSWELNWKSRFVTASCISENNAIIAQSCRGHLLVPHT